MTVKDKKRERGSEEKRRDNKKEVERNKKNVKERREENIAKLDTNEGGERRGKQRIEDN